MDGASYKEGNCVLRMKASGPWFSKYCLTTGRSSNWELIRVQQLGISLEMQILRPQHRPTKSEAMGQREVQEPRFEPAL